MIKAIGMLVGNYPDEFTLAERIKLNQFDSIPSAYYIYLGLMGLIGIAGCVVQFKMTTDITDQSHLTDDPSNNDAYISIDQNDLSIDVPSRKSTIRKKKP